MNEKRVVRNIEIPGINGKKVICDVYGVKPINLELGLRPAVIFLHGGGFVAGDKDQFLGMAALLALEEDILCITVQYRLATEATCPSQIIDCYSVCNWLLHKQKTFSVNPELIFLAGGSPGANIAAMAILSGQEHMHIMDVEKKNIFQPVNGIFLNGIYDLEEFYLQNSSERERVKKYLGEKDIKKASMHFWSPIYAKKAGCNIWMLHGTCDEIVPLQQCVRMKQHLQENGSRAWIKIFPQKHHAWFNSPEEVYSVVEEIARCIKKREREVADGGVKKSKRDI